MPFLFAPPTSQDLIRLLKAWRYWLLGAVAGALIGTVVYFVTPSTFRGRATVNVDFHMEQAWPQNSDREQFYYLERETRKLEEIAMSDEVIQSVVSQLGGGTIAELRGEKLHLSQPGNGGWHFYADDRDPAKASQMASAWAQAFAATVQSQVAQPSSSLEKFITATVTQTGRGAVQPVVGLSVHMLAGALILLSLTGLGVLFFHRAE